MRRILALPWFIHLALLSPGTTVALQQDATILRMDEQCGQCTIERTRVAVLGDSAGPGYVGPWYRIARDARGRFLVAHPANRGEIAVFDGTGDYVATVGREGEGPGEYKFVRHIVPRGDTIHVFDSRLLRHTILSSDFEVLGTRRFRGDPLGVAVLHDTVVVYNVVIPTREGSGSPLHLMDATGRVTNSFGTAGDAASRTEFGFAGWRAIAPAGQESVWAMRKTRYQVEKWSTDDGLLSRFVRQVDWFPPHRREPMPHPDQPPVPFVVDVHEDQRDRLWVLLGLPDPEWYEGIEKSDVPEGTGYQIADSSKFFDSVIEVIDAERGVVLGSGRFDRFFDGIVRGPMVASYRTEPPGFPYIDVWRVGVVP